MDTDLTEGDILNADSDGQQEPQLITMVDILEQFDHILKSEDFFGNEIENYTVQHENAYEGNFKTVPIPLDSTNFGLSIGLEGVMYALQDKTVFDLLLPTSLSEGKELAKERKKLSREIVHKNRAEEKKKEIQIRYKNNKCSLTMVALLNSFMQKNNIPKYKAEHIINNPAKYVYTNSNRSSSTKTASILTPDYNRRLCDQDYSSSSEDKNLEEEYTCNINSNDSLNSALIDHGNITHDIIYNDENTGNELNTVGLSLKFFPRKIPKSKKMSTFHTRVKKKKGKCYPIVEIIPSLCCANETTISAECLITKSNLNAKQTVNQRNTYNRNQAVGLLGSTYNENTDSALINIGIRSCETTLKCKRNFVEPTTEKVSSKSIPQNLNSSNSLAVADSNAEYTCHSNNSYIADKTKPQSIISNSSQAVPGGTCKRSFYDRFFELSPGEFVDRRLMPIPEIPQPVHLQFGKPLSNKLIRMRKSNEPTLAGYNPFRGDFQIEYNNNAEEDVCFASKLGECVTTSSSEDELVQELQVALVEKYNSCLQQRKLRKLLIKKLGLMNQAGTLMWFSRLELSLGKSTMKKLIRLSHLNLPEKTEELYVSLESLNEKRAEENKLSFFRTHHGITTKRDMEVFEKYRKERETGLERVDVRNLIEPVTIKRKKKSLEIFYLPRFKDLTPKEAELCSSILIVPQSFLDIKDVLVSDCKKHNGILLKKARKLIKIDVNKTRKIYDLLMENGLLWPPTVADEKKKTTKKKKTK